MVLLTLGLMTLALFLLSVPVAFALGLSSLATMLIWPGPPLLLAVQKILNGMDSFPLLAIPFFLFAAALMNDGGITPRIIDVFTGALGRFRGSLGLVTVGTNVFLAGISGSAVADATATGSVLIPAMKREGYPPAFAAALTACAAVIGPIIPPSIPLVIYGVVAKVSIIKLFVAGYVPGLLLGGGLLLYVWMQARRRSFPAQASVPLQEMGRRVKRGFWSLLMPVLLIAGIFGGVFTVTELGAVLVVYALVLSLVIYREMDIRRLPEALRRVALDSANVMIIVGVSSLFAYLIVVYQMTGAVAAFADSVVDSRVGALILMNVILLVVGMFLDSTPATIILVPIFMPMARAYGIDLTHLGMIMVFNLMVGLVTPPVALNLYIASRIAGVPIGRVIAELLPMFALLIAVLALITFVPETVLWLPRQLGL